MIVFDALTASMLFLILLNIITEQKFVSLDERIDFCTACLIFDCTEI